MLFLSIGAIISCTSAPEESSQNGIEEENGFVVTQDFYDKTFEEINELIIVLDKIIADKDYDSWLTFLSQDYINTYSDKELLQEKSNSYMVELKTIEDYFSDVVVPSRISLFLEEIVFDDKKHVTAWTTFNENKTKLYQLELIDNSWKISIW